MRFKIFTLVSLLAAVVAASPVAKAEAEPYPSPEAALDALEKRDNWCKTVRTAGCYKCPRSNSPFSSLHPWILGSGSDGTGGDRFGAMCTLERPPGVGGDATWDYVPGWDCWVSAYYTRTAGSQRYCESGLPTCRQAQIPAANWC